MNNKIEFPKLNHDSDDMSKTFGITKNEFDYIITAFLFETVSGILMGIEMYDDIEEAPNELTCFSGILERTNKHLKNKNQQLVALIHSKHIIEAYGNDIRECLNRQNDRKDLRIEEMNLKDLMTNAIKEMKLDIMKEAIRAVKESNYNFLKFIEIFVPEGVKEGFIKIYNSDSFSGIDVSDDLKDFLSNN